jgi:hypothetical protein
MASATGIPQDHPATIEAREDEPLLGSLGDLVEFLSRRPLWGDLSDAHKETSQGKG